MFDKSIYLHNITAIQHKPIHTIKAKGLNYGYAYINNIKQKEQMKNKVIIGNILGFNIS